MFDVHDYRIFTTRFDREVAYTDLDSVLGPLSAENFENLRLTLAEFESARAPRGTDLLGPIAIASPNSLRPEDTVISFLLDQSGSMRGRPMALAAAAVSQAVRQLSDGGYRVEVLGFTTASWRGGRSRRRWNWRLRPRHPGRLCDLLHVIYRDSDVTKPAMPDAVFKSMLRPDLPKENIDGEAILWAADRLLKRPESNKILVVLSDGSPVDDSTQQVNDPLFLDNHLKWVLEKIGSEGRIRISAVGIGYDVSGWYPHSTSVSSADDLGSELGGFLNRLLST